MPIDRQKALDTLEGMQKKDTDLQARLSDDHNTVAHIRGDILKVSDKTANTLRAQATDFIRTKPELFGSVDTKSLIPIHESADAGNNGRNLVLQQYHGKAKVYGGSIRFHTNKSGMIDTISSSLIPDLKEVPKEAKVGIGDAVVSAQKATKSKAAAAPNPQLMVYPLEGKLHLAWEIQLTDDPQTPPKEAKDKQPMLAGSEDLPGNWIVYVDALTAKVINYYNNIQTAGPTVGQGTGYYSRTGQVNSWYNDTTYQLRDTTLVASGGPEIVTNDGHGASPSEDANNDWNDTTTNPRYQCQGAEVDTHRYSRSTYNYFKVVHGRNGFDGRATQFTGTAHYGTNLDNAYWNGANQVYIGDGSGVYPGFKYLSADDIIGHEYTHGYTQYTCGLAYQNESGALNEAFSDIFGSAYIFGDWLVGEEAWLGPDTPALRNMIDPTCGGRWNPADPFGCVGKGIQPSHYSVRYTGAGDYGGVHINSGIINNLFYLLTVGGTHRVSNQQVIGIGQPPCEKMLWRCMTVNLVGKPNATFLDFREAMLDACMDLFPKDLHKLSQAKNAFNAVGIGPDVYVRDNLADTGTEPYTGSYLWASPDIINRNYPSPNPGADFADMNRDNYWQNVYYGQDNYIYVRLQNRGSSIGNSIVYFYFIPASAFSMPGQWISIGQLNVANIPAGGKTIAGPLLFPAAKIPNPGHYCMLAVASSPLDPAPDITQIRDVTEYLEFVRGVNNIAYRNMDVVRRPGGSGLQTEPFQGTLQGEIGAVPGQTQWFSVRVDVDEFVPGAQIKVRGPAAYLDGGIPRNLRLIDRQGDQNIYELIPAQAKNKKKTVVGKTGNNVIPGYGFDDIMVDKNFTLYVDYTLPEGRPNDDKRYKLAVIQYWLDQVLGAFSIYLEKDDGSTARKVTHVKKDANGDILELGNPDEPWWSPVKAGDAIRHIESGKRVYYTSVVNGDRKDIHVVHDRSVEGGKYLRSDPDLKQPNNLDNLKEF
ncbi:MAG TPA: M4 family metallopeptidase [Candidatus Saccharimonadales bacterium]|nr:M4 family metallopeptidase [Candidatus Saccharimonadales bacterium]